MGSEEKRWAGRMAAEKIRTCEGAEMEVGREGGCVGLRLAGGCEVRRVEWSNGKGLVVRRVGM